MIMASRTSMTEILIYTLCIYSYNSERYDHVTSTQPHYLLNTHNALFIHAHKPM